jgi:cytochrome P450
MLTNEGNYLTTDVVCKVVFTVSWDLLVSSANRGLVDTMSAVVHLIGVLHQSPIFTIRRWAPLVFLPTLAWCMKSLREYTISIMKSTKEARAKDPSIRDFFRQFTEAKDPDTGEVALDSIEVRINSENFIAAGSDTTSSSMAAAFFYLIRDPDAYSKVANEVRSAFPSARDIRAGPILSNCVYLRAAINEALRCSPVVPQPLWREAEEGCIVDGELIPTGLNVGAGIYSLHHREEAFPNPFKYDIERWIINPEKDEEEEKERIKEMSKSFAPFSVGPRQCIAKNFALLELMLTFANVFWKLDFKNASGVDGTLGEGGKEAGLPGRERVDEFQLKSYFTSHMDGPMVQFKRRDI